MCTQRLMRSFSFYFNSSNHLFYTGIWELLVRRATLHITSCEADKWEHVGAPQQRWDLQCHLDPRLRRLVLYSRRCWRLHHGRGTHFAYPSFCLLFCLKNLVYLISGRIISLNLLFCNNALIKYCNLLLVLVFTWTLYSFTELQVSYKF